VSSAAGDPYLDPASGVLRNLLGITDAAELARAEAALSASRLIDLERRRLPGRYDLAHLQAFHRCILGDVYAWAGQLRTVSIAKGSVFCLPQHLESYAADVFGRLAAADRLRGLARDPFITGLAGFLAKLVTRPASAGLRPGPEGGAAVVLDLLLIGIVIAPRSVAADGIPGGAALEARRQEWRGLRVRVADVAGHHGHGHGAGDRQ